MSGCRIPLLTALLLCLIPSAVAEDIPLRPEELVYPTLQFEVPDPGKLRVELQNGVPAYILPDDQFPLITIVVFFRGGQYMVPIGMEGLSGLTGRVWRTGGAGDLDAQALDEELDFLAANLSTSIAGTNGSVSLNLLSKDLERGIEILMDVLLRPRFQQNRLEKAKDDLLAGMKERNDSTGAIESREWTRLVYGDDYWLNRLPTQESVEAIERKHLIDFHKRLLHPNDIVLAVVGNFETPEMLALLNSAIGSIRDRGEIAPDVPQPTATPKPGVYAVNKPDVNQGRVSIGHLGLIRPVESEFEIVIANDILGGAGFTSWILSRVRSDEGLAYSAGSSFGINNTYPGTFRAFFQSKSSTCARAARIVLSLVEKVRREGIAQDELQTSQASFVQTFPNRFGSARQTASLYAIDELVRRPHDYWKTYRVKIMNVDLEGVKEAAARYITPDQFVALIVGNIEEILAGHPDYPDASFQDLGPLTRVPLRDPMTLEPLED